MVKLFPVPQISWRKPLLLEPDHGGMQTARSYCSTLHRRRAFSYWIILCYFQPRLFLNHPQSELNSSQDRWTALNLYVPLPCLECTSMCSSTVEPGEKTQEKNPNGKGRRLLAWEDVRAISSGCRWDKQEQAD